MFPGEQREVRERAPPSGGAEMFLHPPPDLPASGAGGGGGAVSPRGPAAVRPRPQPELSDGEQGGVQSSPAQPRQVPAGAPAAAVPVLQTDPSPAVLAPSTAVQDRPAGEMSARL